MDFEARVAVIRALDDSGVEYVLLTDGESGPPEIAVRGTRANLSALDRSTAMLKDMASDMITLLIDDAEWTEMTSLHAPRGVRKFRSFEAMCADRTRREQERAERIRAACNS